MREDGGQVWLRVLGPEEFLRLLVGAIEVFPVRRSLLRDILSRDPLNDDPNGREFTIALLIHGLASLMTTAVDLDHDRLVAPWWEEHEVDPMRLTIVSGAPQ